MQCRPTCFPLTLSKQIVYIVLFPSSRVGKGRRASEGMPKNGYKC